MDKILSRKVIAAIVLLSVSLVCVYVKGDVPVNLLDFLKYLFGFFVAGNSVEHISTAVTDYVTNKNQGESNGK